MDNPFGQGYVWHVGFMFRLVLTLLIFCLVAVPGFAGDQLWEWVTPLPQGHDLFAAASGNGVVVAVGRGGTIVTRGDGGEWVMTQSGEGYPLTDVVWANGLFVAVGGDLGFEFNPEQGVILTSDDGSTWVERYRTESLTLTAVAWTGSRFVAVGIGDRVLLSPDGLSWSEQQLESIVGMLYLAWNGSKLVGAGGDDGYIGAHSYFTSDNGEQWFQAPFGCEFCQPKSIVASNGRFVVAGPWLKALVTDDGLAWIEAPYAGSISLERVAASDDGFVAIGPDIVGRSIDGYQWSVAELPTEEQVYSLAWCEDQYLAVGDDGFMMSSSDGSQWTQLSKNSFDLTGTLELNELATNGPIIVGVGEAGVIVTGRHGTDWERRSAPIEAEFNAVIWTGSAFWTAGQYGVLRSTDGVHWAQMLLDYGVRLFDIDWNGSLFVAVGWRPRIDGRKVILTSPDGHEWTYHFLDYDGHLFTVGWTGSRWVAVGSGARLYTSADGLTWQPRTLDEGLTLKDMAWNGSRLVAVGGRYEYGGLILTTEDGVSWVESTQPEAATREFDDVTWTGTHFVAVSRASGDVIFTSTDGLEWTSETTATGVWPVSAVGDDRSLYVTGGGLKIIRRTEPLRGIEAPRRPDRRVVPGVGVRKENSPPVSLLGE